MLFSVITLLKEEILVLAHAQPLTTEIFERIRGHGAESTTATTTRKESARSSKKREIGLSGNDH
ncbi:MAG TPA: hypothetical protein VGG70_04035, partial [Candidatus Cybelea sp.]